VLGIVTDSLDNIYVIDWGNNRIRKFDSNGNFIMKRGTEGTGDKQFDKQTSNTIDSCPIKE
jgi:hypothetical protein